MKRDMELVRKILLKLEEAPDSNAICNLSIDGYTLDEVAYHCQLIEEKGLARNYTELRGDGKLVSFGIGTLTDDGHDLINKIRNETVWEKVKTFIVKKGLKFTLDVIIQVAPQVIANLME